jgi:GWxTD domain-containing protein
MIKMRTGFKILFLFLLLGCTTPLFAGGPEAYLNFATYSAPNGKTFFETYLSVMGNSLRFVKSGKNKYAGKAHVTLSFKLHDSVVASANFNLVSPEVSDTLTKPNFVDAHRFWIPKGTYTLTFTLDDPNDASHKTITGKQAVRVGYPADTVSISDAEFLNSFTPSNEASPYNKCGYYMVPYVFSYYPQGVNRLSFYCEIYNTPKIIPREKFKITYSIESDGGFTLDQSSNFTATTLRDADTVVPLMAQVPIGNLPTGNYFLSISVVDMNNHTLAKKRYSFSKENPGMKSNQIPQGFAVYMSSRDTLEESIRCLAPISKYNEQGYVISDSLNYVSMIELKRWFYYFWQSRDSTHPLEAWEKYLSDVMKVNHSFNMPNLKGYRTDRGRVYLQYGPPNIRDVEKSNPATYPHEIWEYYKLPDGQTDVKFVFYSTAVETNNYVLLHSTATGETQNPHWQSALYSSVGTLLPSNLDNEKVVDPTGQDPIGEDVNDEFNNPH